MELEFLLKDIISTCRKYAAKAAAAGDNYNIFRVIKMPDDEVRIHSAFIANLLNPTGSHGMGAAFLELFVQQQGIIGFDCSSAIVVTEKYIGSKTETDGGKIDLDICDSKDFHVIIENKIYAGDQDNQLLRYSRYGDKCRKHALYYLTLFGDMPDETKSCRCGEFSIKEGKDYRRISYCSDILSWLESCREKVAGKPLLREGLSHYINLIKYLTGQNTNENMKKEIIDELMSPDNIKYIKDIQTCLLDAQIEIQRRFWDSLSEGFKQRVREIIRSNYDMYIPDYYYKSRDNKYYGFEIMVERHEKFSISYGIRLDNLVYGGFTVWEGDDNGANKHAEYAKYVEIARRIYSGNNNDYWLSWKYLLPYIDFKRFDENTSLAMSRMPQTVESIIMSVEHDIELFRQYSSELR